VKKEFAQGVFSPALKEGYALDELEVFFKLFLYTLLDSLLESLLS
jgi:hypothetical protein